MKTAPGLTDPYHNCAHGSRRGMEAPMADEITRKLADLKDRMQSGESTAAEQVEMRDQLVQMQYRLRAIEFQLEDAHKEVQNLAVRSISGLVYTMMGTKGERLEHARATHEELENQYGKCSGDVAELERQVAGLESRIHENDSSAEEYKKLLADKQDQISNCDDERGPQLKRLREAADAARTDVKCVERALKAGADALRDLNEQIETVSTLGRCPVIEGNHMLRGVMAASRHKTSHQCAERVKRSICRFRRALNDVFERCGSETDAALLEINAWLERVCEDFAGVWLSREACGEQSADYVSERIRMANMVVEKTLNTVRDRAKAAEDASRSYVESA